MSPTPETPSRSAAPTSRPAGRRDWVWLVVGGVVFVVLPVGGLIWWWAARPAPPPPPEVVLDAADPEVREAVETARKQLLDEPHSAEAWGKYGMVLRAHNFETAADPCFAEAERRDPGDARWPYYRGLYAEFNQADGVPRGLPHFRRALRIGHPDPEYRGALQLRLAEALADRGEFDEAEALFREKLEQSPGDPRATLGLGLIAAARGDVPAATARLAAVGGPPAARQKAAAQLAALALRAGDPAATARHQAAAASEPETLTWPDPFVRDLEALQVGLKAQLGRLAALEKDGRTQDTLALLLELARTHPSAQIYYRTAAALGRDGDNARAEQYLRESLKLDPDFAPARHLLAVSLFLQASERRARDANGEAARGMFRECVDHFRKSLARKPDNADGHRCLGQALVLLGEKAEGVKELRLAVACRPERYEGYLYLGEVLAELGETDEALRNLRTAEQLAPQADPRPRTAIHRLTKGKG